MDDEIAVVHEHPRRVVQPLDRARLRVGLLGELLLDLFDDRANQARVRRTRNDEALDDADDVSDVEDDDVFALLVVRRICSDP
jgi:hypothetical protein